MADRDLSNINQRRNTQDRITTNRDAVLPTRRETRVDSIRPAADMRAAQRGKEQADEIRRLFGMAGDATEAYFRHDIAQTAVQAEDDYATGIADAAAGREIDPEQAKQYAYRRGFTSITAAAAQTTFERETAQEADAMINRGATMDEIEAYYGERNAEFVASTLDTYDTDEVRVQVADRLSRWSNAEDNRIGTAVKEKTDREFLETTTGEIQARLGRGEAVDLGAEVANLEAAGLNGVVVQDAIVKSIGAYAVRTRDKEALFALDDARPAEDVAAEVEEARTAELNSPAIEGAPLPPVAPANPAPVSAPVETYKSPVSGGRRTSGFGPRRALIPGASTNHMAVDIAVPVGTEVGATASGVVEFAGTRGNAGKMMIIRHADGSSTEFMHLSGFKAEQGATVSQGQIVALSGNTGNSSGAHLHWAVKDARGNPINPDQHVGKQIAGTPTLADSGAADGSATDSSVKNEARRPRRPGRSILTSEQQMYVTGLIEQIESDTERDIEKARQDKRDTLATELYEASLSGKNVDDRITAAMRDGTLNASEAMSYRNAFTSLRNDQLEGEADDDVVLKYAERFATERPNWSSISSQADRDYQAGRFGSGRAATRAYLDIKQRAASGSRGDNAIPPEERRTAIIARGYVASSLGGMFPAGVAPSDPQRRLMADAQIEWERRVASGQSPMTAADNVFNEYSPRIRSAGRSTTGPGTNGAGNTRAPGETQTATAPRRVRYDATGKVIGD